ncbi:hypothetical protein M408DRAFT_235346 [Serendipita vermifera MAFF 305830]|uniref:Uncharacterized protein n=1 Tax=Serendipita vermifera MAFF 305830 TaxID=933852 RepID=A0A0C2XRT3_SERVB|nr:hypothetical protein M408DRAFT_235346 [Serendipita vermifera MAFF 305830]
MPRGSLEMLNSDLSSSSVYSRHYTRHSRAPSAAALAILALVATPATASPIPLLDFLYPSFYISSSPSTSPGGHRAPNRRRPERERQTWTSGKQPYNIK